MRTLPVTFVSVEDCRDEIATDVVVGSDTFVLYDVSRGDELGTVRTDDERVSTLKMYLIYINLFSQKTNNFGMCSIWLRGW